MQNKHKEVYAGFVTRLFAFLIDSILAGIVALIVRGSASSFASRFPISLDDLVFSFGFADICAYLATVMYFVIFARYTSGKTPGKSAMGIEIINADGTRAGFWKLLYRETVGRYLSSILCIGYIMAAFTKEKTGLHDILSDTRVVFSAGRNTAMPQTQTVPTVTVSQETQTKADGLPCPTESEPPEAEQKDEANTDSEHGADIPAEADNSETL